MTDISPPPSSFKPLTSVLVKPAGADCNLACHYCFYLKKEALYPETSRHRMSEAVLEAMVRQMMQSGSPEVSFGWQGGEPTLMGLPFFRRAVEFQQRYGEQGQSVGNGLQTNGLLLDAEWAEFLGEYHFLVGLSLDGPEAIHNHYRLSRGGEPTWGRVIQSARLLLRQRVPVNALCVVNNLSARQPDALYDFFKSEGLRHMQFIPCREPDPARPGAATPFSVEPKQYGEFLCRLFDRWLGDFRNGLPTTSIRWFDSVFYTYVGLPAPECTLLEECGIYVVVEHNGDVYACDFFVEPDWKLGNVLGGDDLLELLNGPRQRAFGRIKSQLPPTCVECPWLRHCAGGCPRKRQVEGPQAGLSHFCAAYKQFFKHAHPRLEQLATRWLKQQEKTRRPGNR